MECTEILHQSVQLQLNLQRSLKNEIHPSTVPVPWFGNLNSEETRISTTGRPIAEITARRSATSREKFGTNRLSPKPRRSKVARVTLYSSSSRWNPKECLSRVHPWRQSNTGRSSPPTPNISTVRVPPRTATVKIC